MRPGVDRPARMAPKPCRTGARRVSGAVGIAD